MGASTSRRKQFVLPQDKIDQVKKILGVKTEREAIVLSLDGIIRQRELAKFAALSGRLRLNLTQASLRKMRGG